MCLLMWQTILRKKQISGQAFLALTEDDIKELVPLIGTRTLVCSIVKDCKVKFVPGEL